MRLEIVLFLFRMYAEELLDPLATCGSKVTNYEESGLHMHDPMNPETSRFDSFDRNGEASGHA